MKAVICTRYSSDLQRQAGIADPSGKTVTWRAHGNGCAHYSGPGKVLAPAVRP